MRKMLFGVLTLTLALAACAQTPVPETGAASASATESGGSADLEALARRKKKAPVPMPVVTPTVPVSGITLPPTRNVVWDWQIGASSDSAIGLPGGANLIDLDGFTVSAGKIAALKSQGVYTVCYLDVGSYEPGRPDSAQYPGYLKLQQDPDWPAEYFLDINDVFKPNSVLASLLTARMQMCKTKGFDAVEPDNLQNDENVSGGRITAQQQLDFNSWIADRAHATGLAVFQKNGPDKILKTDSSGKAMVDKFDGILNEQCQEYGECAALAEYTKRGKLALDVEYRKSALNCTLMQASGIVALRKDLGLVGQSMSGYLRESCS